jgi:hypothetical protein
MKEAINNLSSKSEFFLKMIISKMQDFIRLSSTFCGEFLHQTMHFADSTCLAINCFREFILLNHLNTLNFVQLMNNLESTMIEFKMSKSWRRFRYSEFSRLNQICMLIQVFLTDEIKLQQQHVALHVYVTYFLIRLHMHKNVSMRVTIVFFFDQSREWNENNVSWWNSDRIREFQFDDFIAQLVINDHRLIIDNIYQLIRDFYSFICKSQIIYKSISIKRERIITLRIVNNTLV